MNCFETENLSFTYRGAGSPALENVSLKVSEGEYLALIGASGCGKTTLLRTLKTALTPHGTLGGTVLFEGKPLSDIDDRTQAAKIGFVLQNPDNQLVTDKVWHELAFGLESLGFKNDEIRRRVAETAAFFDIEDLFHKKVSELSGGQKQLVNLAAVMAMQPSVLLLDEPTGQLDPIAAASFVAATKKINRELGTTVIITEHRLEEIMSACGRTVVMDSGRIIFDGDPREVGGFLSKQSHKMLLSMPVPVRIHSCTENNSPCPLDVREGRAWIRKYASENPLKEVVRKEYRRKTDPTPAAELRDVWFSFGGSEDVIRGLSLKAYHGELLAVVGGNGAGKTTALNLMSGVFKPDRGTVCCNGEKLNEKKVPEGIAVLPQSPQALFLKKTVKLDLLSSLESKELTREEKEKSVDEIAVLCRLANLLERHPYDLSGGEQQRAALAKLLLAKPSVILMDEPTKGLDGALKELFADIISELCKNGVCVVIVSHDVEFCASYADRCVMLFDGRNVSENTPDSFFGGNMFYTTAASRMFSGVKDNVVTADDAVLACGGTQVHIKPAYKLQERKRTPETSREVKAVSLSHLRRAAALLCAVSAAVFSALALRGVDLTQLVRNENVSIGAIENKWIYLGIFLSLFALALCVSKKNGHLSAKQKGVWELSRSAVAAIVLIVFAVPMTLFIGTEYFGGRRYFITSMLIVLETLLPFFLSFEKRRPKAREIVIISMLCALGVVGRLVFFAVPGFKPVMAIVIIAGVAFGAETGFMTGALTMLASNMLFGQGPWTPWQMFAMGIIGFLSGLLFRRGALAPTKIALCVFGALCAIAVYGGIMNPSSVLMYQQNPTWQMFLTAYLTGFPADLMHAASTVFFLWAGSQPMLEKLERIKLKYGI